MREGRPGPVLIDLPLDVQKGEIVYDPEADCALSFQRQCPNPVAIRKAIDLILAAKQPVMLLGGGVIIAEACDLFVRLAEYLQAPVVTTYMGKSGIPYSHPLAAGHVGIQCNTRSGNKTFLESDLVLAVGVRFNDRHTGDIATYTANRKFIHIDIDPGQLGKNIMPELAIVSDAKQALSALLEEVQKRRSAAKPSTWAAAIPEVKAALKRKMDYNDIPIKAPRVYKEINEFFGPETVFVTCIGLNQIWSGQMQEIEKPRHYLDCGGAGPLGWDLPAAIGAKVARPDKQVVQVVGDYGFQFCMEELPVAVMYDVPFIVLVLNNGYLGLIRQSEKYLYEMECEVEIWYDGVNEGRGFDFVKFAEACGAKGERVTDPGQLKAAFKRAQESGGPYVVDIILEKTTDCSMGASIASVREFE
jgi:tartronate-semialdehyde synthase